MIDPQTLIGIDGPCPHCEDGFKETSASGLLKTPCRECDATGVALLELSPYEFEEYQNDLRNDNDPRV